MSAQEPAALCESCTPARIPGYETNDHGCTQPADVPLVGSLTGVSLQRRCGCGCARSTAS